MKLIRWLNKPTRIGCTIMLLVSLIFPLIGADIAEAYGLVTSRSITISSASDAASNATTTYTTSFNVATTGVVAGMVVDVCSNDPIIGDSCTAPTGFTWGATPSLGTVTTTGQSGLSWSAASANSGRTLELTTSGTVSGQVSAGANVNFVINNVQNPTTLGTYYARVYTFNTSANVSGAVSATGVATTNVTDAGGIALSTAQIITVTAKVQEQITFCVGDSTLPSSGASATAQTSCSSLTSSNVNLGNSNGVLSSSVTYTDVSTQYIIGTNASGGAAIVLKGNTLTSGGGQTISAIGSTQTSSATGTSQFGLCTYEASGTNLSFTNETNGASGAYDNSACNSTTQSAGYNTGGGTGTAKFGFNTTATTSSAGDPLAIESAGPNSTGVIAMIGNIPTTQVAGIYTTTLSFIATGTY